MKETVLDILIYLFENYFDADLETTAEPDRETLKDELERAGFAALEVDRAIEWLEGLAAGPMQRTNAPTSRAIRVFNSREQSLLDIECRGYILYLENIGILNAEQREVVIDRLLALDGEEVEIEQVKWVVLLVLFSQPGQETEYSRMEDLVFENRLDAVH